MSPVGFKSLRVPRAVSVLFPAILFAAAHVDASRVSAVTIAHHFAFACCVGARACAADSVLHAVVIHCVNNAVVACASSPTAAAAACGGGSLAPATAAYAACALLDVLLMLMLMPMLTSNRCRHSRKQGVE
jgi:membrane protease YdiL (CAAX protease family)